MADSLNDALQELDEMSVVTSGDTLVINNDLRTITVPNNFIFGVYNDKNVLSVDFEMPRFYDDIDLSDFSIQINYQAASGIGNIYEITTPTIGTDKITFEWLLDRGVFLKAGDVTFIVCLRQILDDSDGTVVREFNTTVAKGRVLEGLEVEDPEDPEAYSIIAHLKAIDQRVTAQASDVNAKHAAVSAMASEATSKYNEAIAAINGAKEFYGSPLTAATAAAMTDQNKVYVYTGSETGYTAGNWYYHDGTSWVSGGVYNSIAVNTDETLAIRGMAADAKKVGDEITDLKEDLSKIEPGLSAEAKAALLACFDNVVWKNANGSQLYDTLESALYAEDYPRITAIFNPDTNKIYTDDTLETLKQYLTVTYYEVEGSAGVSVPSNEYVLTGTLTEGTNSVIVTYQRYTTVFSVTAIDFYNIWTRKLSDGTLTKIHASVDTNQSNTSMYPSRTCILDPYEVRRDICVERGKAPYYYKNQTNVASPYYPIPIPFGANHAKITMEPLGQYAYVHFVPYDAETNTYGNSTVDTRIPWGQFDANGLEMTLDGTKQWYMVMNTKYDSAGTSYPVEPTEITVEFSEV